ncbi:Beta-1,3-N-Acetylglucosaminyltransferase family [Olea europaea subsp. europaea]|uniref:Beta-1,3-N-Acetylglucosaminyltransferase family n=2 Tax=Olea europaea subsp. europaea TaxID=158383 RepID=A0A8S0QNJ3_OLEEU|nr:Beta-1,3-N-Acetylglucosaminyltransferase family [Olea europaea subsp. europaea]
MEFFNKFLCFLLFACFMTRGSLQCFPGTVKDLVVNQVRTNAESKVTITNKCVCSFLEVTLLCPGFDSVKKIDPPSAVSMNGRNCLINNGNPIYGGKTFEFTYTSDVEIAFAPLSFREACS